MFVWTISLIRKSLLPLSVACLAALPLPATAQTSWQAVERIETYAVSGTTGADLYASIGARGPKVGGLGRAIAVTTFKLTWTRDYQRRGDACVLASARPKLIITYALPKPKERLSASMEESWNRFLAGVTAHEKVHGEMIRELVLGIEAVSVGLTVENDPKCRRIREVLTEKLGALSQAQRQKSRAFDAAELGENGPVRKLILDLVNGP